MRKAAAVILILWTTLADLGAAQRVALRGPSTVSAAVESALRRLDEAELQGTRKRDAKFVDEVYAADAVVFPVYLPLKFEGRDGAREAWQSFYDRFAEIKKSDWSERIYHAAGPSSAWMTCLWHLEALTSDGDPVEINLRVTRQYEKRQGRWLVVHEHFSIPQR